MRKNFKYASIAIMGILLLSAVSTSVLAAVSDYMPNDEDVEGYNLLWEAEYSTPDLLDPTTNVSGGAQIWYKNATGSTVTAVIGTVVVEMEDNPLLDEISASLKLLLELGGYGDYLEGVDTYWDLMVKYLTEAPEISDITDVIQTTEGSIEFNFSTSLYMILSVDIDVTIFSFAFDVSNEWIAYVQEHAAELPDYYDGLMSALQGFVSAFASIASILSGSSLPDASAAIYEPIAATTTPSTPSGDSTEASDVQAVTTEIGDLFSKGIPGYAPLLILGIAGVFALYFMKSKKVVIQ